MEETIESVLAKGKEGFEKAMQHLNEELRKIRAGKASPAMLNGLMVSYYGNPTPLTQVANISTPDSKTLSIQPWEKNLLSHIERSIFEANLGLTPMNDGEFVRISIPAMTEERRKDLAKQSKASGEEARVGLRNVRHKLIDFVRKEVKDGYPEDAGKKREAEVDSMVKNYYSKIDNLIEAKEKEIMTV
ncbi:MAG: ribosome recycling factor [Saprospiraceae bacterium]|jgi:ribosome recycling factor